MQKPNQVITDYIVSFGSKSIPSVGYYVYVITEDNIPCYFGKGKKNRVLEHFKNNGKSLVSYKIRENKPAFNWFIKEYFDTEKEALLFETDQIKKAKLDGIKLYNTIHYSNKRYQLTMLCSCLEMSTKYEKLYYYCGGTKYGRVIFEGLLKLIKDIAKGYSEQEIPTFKGKSVTELSVRTIPAINNYEQYELI